MLKTYFGAYSSKKDIHDYKTDCCCPRFPKGNTTFQLSIKKPVEYDTTGLKLGDK